MLMAGWRGIYCDTPCPAGRWGPECGLMCQCHNDGVCHHVTGENCLRYPKSFRYNFLELSTLEIKLFMDGFFR